MTYMTLDEIVAHNLRQILEARGMTVTALADLLHRKRHVVYDMVGARKDREQKAFRWSEIAALCGALNVPIDDLVLPPEGVAVASDDLLLFIPDSKDSTLVSIQTDERLVIARRVGRDGLSATLFAWPGSEEGDRDWKRDQLARALLKELRKDGE